MVEDATPHPDRLLIERARDGNRDGNRGELWRTSANVGGRSSGKVSTPRTWANDGERWRTENYGLENH
jgi:hypothetical protein